MDAIRTSLQRVASVPNDIEITGRGEQVQREYWRDHRAMVLYADKVPTWIRMDANAKRIPAKGGEEQDCFSGWRRLLVSFGRSGVARAAKRSYARRFRKAVRQAVRMEVSHGVE